MKKLFFIVMALLMLIQSLAFANPIMLDRDRMRGGVPEPHIETVVSSMLSMINSIAIWANVIFLIPLILVAIFVKKKAIRITAIVIASLLIFFLLSTFMGRIIWMSLL